MTTRIKITDSTHPLYPDTGILIHVNDGIATVRLDDEGRNTQKIPRRAIRIFGPVDGLTNVSPYVYGNQPHGNTVARLLGIGNAVGTVITPPPIVTPPLGSVPAHDLAISSAASWIRTGGDVAVVGGEDTESGNALRLQYSGGVASAFLLSFFPTPTSYRGYMRYRTVNAVETAGFVQIIGRDVCPGLVEEAVPLLPLFETGYPVGVYEHAGYDGYIQLGRFWDSGAFNSITVAGVSVPGSFLYLDQILFVADEDYMVTALDQWPLTGDPGDGEEELVTTTDAIDGYEIRLRPNSGGPGVVSIQPTGNQAFSTVTYEVWVRYRNTGSFTDAKVTLNMDIGYDLPFTVDQVAYPSGLTTFNGQDGFRSLGAVTPVTPGSLGLIVTSNTTGADDLFIDAIVVTEVP